MKIVIDQRGPQNAYEDRKAYRNLLQAFAYPGKMVAVREGQLAHSVILATLADETTPVWIDEGFAGIKANGSKALDREKCVFALCRGERFNGFDGFPVGTLVDPHLSTTMLIEVVSLTGGEPWRLAGPGVGPNGASLAPIGLPKMFPPAWAQNNALYPLGIDVIFTAGELCACLPRSVRLEIADVCAG
ncbi:phosphonate C-P lyase system protein PhnH [Rhizobium rhizoryzae]|uniref:phosphonate C-P lyase system protein PhnH n=1 Tax=Rhizobium rhizoryzae TaxID=451876 RepID=UPI00289B2CE3|nr:phosphonate C-P lyase system protein PhnH [Rhizobium rhizoryzae]